MKPVSTPADGRAVLYELELNVGLHNLLGAVEAMRRTETGQPGPAR
jgi:hypothetical protein